MEIMSKQNKPSEGKQQVEKEPARTAEQVPDGPELWGYGIAQVPGGWAAIRLSTHGAVESITALRNGQPAGESKHQALLRMQDVQERELVHGRQKVKR